MKINTQYIKMLFIASTLFLASCSEDEPQLPKGDYENGILISGEGSGAGTGSISFISNDLSEAKSKIFNKVNNEELGTFLQSVAFDNEKAYIIVDNQKTITIVDRYTFKKLNTITSGITKPRYMTIVGDKAYITDWGEGTYQTDNREDDYVAVINLKTFESSKISVEAGPERIIEKDGKLYVSHKGGFGSNNKVSIIDIAAKTVEKVIVVNDKPDELVFDNQGNLLVLCSGKAAWTGNETLASISKIKLSDKSVSKVEFAKGKHPSLMVLDNQTIYYSIGNKVFKTELTSTTLPTDSFLTIELFTTGYPSFYGMAVKDNKLYALNTSFTDVSQLQVFKVSDKQKIKTLEAPIGASKIYFN